ncbi:TIM barrel protein [Pannonibacter sp. Q-1]|jgi:2-keto-myo-inositol isomerase
MSAIRFSLNRTCSPQMTLEQFVALAHAVGVEAVEVRNDIAGREFANGMDALSLRAILSDAGLKLASINALQRFNDWTDARAEEALQLIRYAAALGAPGIVMCPVIEADHGWSEADLERKLRQSLRALRPMFLDHGVIGFVEPLGMKDSTMKMQEAAVAAVSDIGGWDAFQICHDTFQFYRCGDTRMFPEHIGLVHISGIAREDLPPHELTEPDRGFVFAGDRAGNIGQLRTLIEGGYQGYISVEPFNPDVQLDPEITAHLKASIDHVSDACGLPATA